MERDHTREHKVRGWRKTDNPKWHRFVKFFAQVRKQDRWLQTDISYNDVVDEFEEKDC